VNSAAAGASKSRAHHGEADHAQTETLWTGQWLKSALDRHGAIAARQRCVWLR